MRSHIIIKVFPSYTPLSLSISTRHKDQRGKVEKSIPRSLSTGYIHCSLHDRSWAANTIGWRKVSCDLSKLSLYLWLRLKLRWSKGSVVWKNVNGAVDKILKWFFVRPLWDNEWEREKSQSVNGDIRLDEGILEEARTIEGASGWTNSLVVKIIGGNNCNPSLSQLPLRPDQWVLSYICNIANIRHYFLSREVGSRLNK